MEIHALYTGDAEKSDERKWWLTKSRQWSSSLTRQTSLSPPRLSHLFLSLSYSLIICRLILIVSLPLFFLNSEYVIALSPSLSNLSFSLGARSSLADHQNEMVIS